MKNPVHVEIYYASGRKENRSIESGRWPAWKAALEECKERGSVKSFNQIDASQLRSQPTATARRS